ncbi:MAG: hypothetical protein R3A44_20325 [Caldilineaceae bacterium]
MGQFAAAFALLERSLAILRQVKANSSDLTDELDGVSRDYITQTLGQCLGFFGWLEYFRGEFDHALVLLEESAPPERRDRGTPGSFVALARIKFQQGAGHCR